MRGNRPNRRTLKYRIKRTLIVLLVILAGSLALLSVQIFRGTPGYDELRSIEQVEASQFLASDGELIGSWFHQNRSRVPLRQISPDFIEALLATEDIRYYEHNGIDYRSLIRVAFKTILLQQDTGGGSTITQQLVKNLYPRKGTGPLGLLKDKLREMLTARRMESLYSKTEILELYLNTVSFGEDTFGIETASRRYFGVSASGLELHQAALLAGLLRAPGAYNPRLYPERARLRRNIVFGQMEKYNMINRQEKESMEETPLGLNYHRISTSDGHAPHFREQLRKDLQNLLQEIPGPAGRSYNLYTDGLVITTTIDLSLQRIAEQALSEQVQRLQAQLDRSLAPSDSLPEALRQLNGGFLAITPNTGEVKAWVGGIDYGHVQYDHVTSRRQTGSAFKPILYASALEAGVAPCDYHRSRLNRYEEWDGWTPENVAGEYGEYWSVQAALAHSVNTISVELLMETGLDQVREMALRFGLQQVPAQPSIALGTAEASLLEMLPAYAVFASGGKRVRPWYIKSVHDAEGRLLYQKESIEEKQAEQVLEPHIAEAILRMLSKAVNEGTARPLRTVYGLHGNVAGKTGTTQNYSDGWFIGTTPGLVFGVWTGAPSPRVGFPPEYGFASQTALPVAGRFLASADPSATGINNNFTFSMDAGEYRFNCQDMRDPSLLDRFRDAITGQQPDEPREIRPERDRPSIIDRVRNLFR